MELLIKNRQMQVNKRRKTMSAKVKRKRQSAKRSYVVAAATEHRANAEAE